MTTAISRGYDSDYQIIDSETGEVDEVKMNQALYRGVTIVRAALESSQDFLGLPPTEHKRITRIYGAACLVSSIEVLGRKPRVHHKNFPLPWLAVPKKQRPSRLGFILAARDVLGESQNALIDHINGTCYSERSRRNAANQISKCLGSASMLLAAADVVDAINHDAALNPKRGLEESHIYDIQTKVRRSAMLNSDHALGLSDVFGQRPNLELIAEPHSLSAGKLARQLPSEFQPVHSQLVAEVQTVAFIKEKLVA